jgi:alkylhydroperoxidase/carboxymuconolactone decarboxylase family protein YurZ
MGILETLKSFLAMEPESTGKERIMAENLTAEQADKYMEEKMLFTPRMFKVINQLAPQAGKTFADFYESIWADGNLPRKIKELIFMAGGVAYMSPRCIIHVVPAVKAGATVGEVFESMPPSALKLPKKWRRAKTGNTSNRRSSTMASSRTGSLEVLSKRYGFIGLKPN